MGTFGSEFWNVTALDSTQLSLLGEMDQPAIPMDDARVILARILAAANRSPLPGVIVYLPPRDYAIGPQQIARRLLQDAWNAPDLLVQPKVTLWFAPGARLIIRPEAVVRIGGPLRAEVTQIFRCDGTDISSESVSPGPAPQRRGRVLLYSTKVTQVYPEWWGAVAYPDDPNTMPSPAMLDDTDALVDCIRAAHTDRAFPNGNAMPTIPIALRGKYFISREIEVKGPGPVLRSGLPDRMLTFEDRGPPPENALLNINFAGIILRGGQQGGSQSPGSATLQAMSSFTPNGRASNIKTLAKTRALLRLDGLHASVIDGITFSGGDPSDPIASVCVQVTGNNARSTVFRGCSFVNARQILVQAGDYIIVNTRLTETTGEGASARSFNPLQAGLSGGWDLSGLRFENCRFESELIVPEVLFPNSDSSRPPLVTQAQVDASVVARATASRRAQEVTGIVFHAHNTLPMTLDHCFFVGGMAACVAAYGGTMIVRGGGAQNSSLASPRSFGAAPEEPVGGVDFFLGDPILREAAEAASPTGLTVVQFESQSDQFLSTFSHVSASFGRVAFYPTVLQGVSQRATSGNTLAPPSVVWLGPGIRPAARTPLSAPSSTLTLVGCVFGGRRGMNDVEASGAVVVDALAFLVGDVGTRMTNPAPAVFYTRLGTSITPTVLEGMMRPVWLRIL